MALLELQDVGVRYGKARAVMGLSLRVDAGELVGVIGPNGAGKTTLLRAISRVVPAEGRLRFAGQDLLALRPHQVAAQGIAHCPEGRRLFPELSVLKNLELGAFLRRDREGIREDLERVFTLFPVLRDRQPQAAGTLSGGEQQMAAIGRAVMGRPRLLLLDEPSTGLSARLKSAIFEAVARIRDAGTGVLLVEQDAVSTFQVASRVYVLEHGTVAREGPAAALAEDPAVRQLYLGVP